MSKIFISVGMNGRTHEEIADDIIRADQWITENLKDKGFDEIEVINNLDCTAPKKASRLWCLGQAIIKLGNCDACYFVKGWENYKGCRAEMEICKIYGIEVYEE